MVTFIVLFFPAILSLWIWETLHKSSLNLKNFLYLYSLNALLINFGCFAVKRWIRHSGNYPLENLTSAEAINYLIPAISLAVVLALAEHFLCKYVRLRIESNSEEEKKDEDRK